MQLRCCLIRPHPDLALHLAQDTSWLDVYLSEVPHVVYHNGDAAETAGAQHATLLNKGTEAMGYLQFIVDYYDRLPATVLFIHGHRCSAQCSVWGRACSPIRHCPPIARAHLGVTHCCTCPREDGVHPPCLLFHEADCRAVCAQRMQHRGF